MHPKSKQFAKTQPLPPRSKPRWVQLAATTAVPVAEFRGYADIKSNPLYRNRSSLSRKSSASTSAIGTSRSLQNNGSSSAQKANDLLNDPECISIRDHIEEPHKLDEYDDKFLMKLATHLRIYSQDLACKGNYPEARKASNKRDFVIDACRSRKPVEEPNNDVADLEKIIQEYKDKWEKEVKEFDEETENKLVEINKKGQERLEALDDDWENNIVEQYRKPSANLIRQRTLEARMIQNDQIEKAAFIHETVKRLEEEEAKSAQTQFEKDYNEAKKAAIIKNQQEVESYKFMRECHRNFLFQNIEKDQDVMNHRLAVLKTKPKPLEPYKHPSNEVAARPAAVLSDSEDLRPGKKLPMLVLPKTKKAKQTKSNNISVSNSNLSQNSLYQNKEIKNNEIENDNDQNKEVEKTDQYKDLSNNSSSQKLEGGELSEIASDVTDGLLQS